jgi:hypothetical protein
LKTTSKFVWDNGIKALELVCGAARDRTWAKDIRIKGQHFLKGNVQTPRTHQLSI